MFVCLYDRLLLEPTFDALHRCNESVAGFESLSWCVSSSKTRSAMNPSLVLSHFCVLWICKKRGVCMYPITQWRMFNCSVKRKQQGLRPRVLFSILALAKWIVQNSHKSSLSWDSLIQVCSNSELKEKYQISRFKKAPIFARQTNERTLAKFFPTVSKKLPFGRKISIFWKSALYSQIWTLKTQRLVSTKLSIR